MTLKSKRHPYHPATVARFDKPSWDQVCEATHKSAEVVKPQTYAERHHNNVSGLERLAMTDPKIRAGLAKAALITSVAFGGRRSR